VGAFVCVVSRDGSCLFYETISHTICLPHFQLCRSLNTVDCRHVPHCPDCCDNYVPVRKAVPPWSVDRNVGLLFLGFVSTIGFLALACLFLRPVKVRPIKLGYNLLTPVVLFSVFRHENHDIGISVTFMLSTFASNLILYFAMRFDRGVKAGSS